MSHGKRAGVRFGGEWQRHWPKGRRLKEEAGTVDAQGFFRSSIRRGSRETITTA